MALGGEPVLSVDVEDKSFGLTRVLGRISFDVGPNTLLVILGPSGCGKTTLLRIIAGLDQEFVGQISLQAERVTAPTYRVGMMFQDVRLFPWMTVATNLEFAMASHNGTMAAELLTLVGLRQDVLQMHPRQLSGGMAKRVALARALAGNPAVLLLDEPFSDLDPKAKYALYDVLSATITSQERPVSAVMVTHDISEAVYLADRIIVLSETRPTTVASSVIVQLPRPRRRDAPEFVKICTSLMVTALKTSVQESAIPNPSTAS